MIFIEGGRLFINEGGAITEHLSPFARDKVADEEKAQQKNAWKNEAPDDPHNPMFSRQVLWGGKGGGTKAVPPRFVLAQVVGRRLYYVLSMSRSHGLFYFDRDAGSEVRLFHKEEFQPRGLYVDAIGRVYTTRTNADHSTHIIRFDEDGKNIKVLTAGDCCDENPYLVGSRLYYQSAGIGRTDGENHDANERDADGRRLWEAPPEAKADGENADDAANHPAPGAVDPTGTSGSQLDLSG